jgi:putative transposase
MFAAATRKRRLYHQSFSQWRWHLDEVFVRINGETHYLWRAIDHEGEVLEVFATKRRDRRAALKFLKRAMKRYGRPRSIVTDRLRSYRSAMKVIGNAPIRSAVGGSTIARKIPTSRSDDENERCRGSGP